VGSVSCRSETTVANRSSVGRIETKSKDVQVKAFPIDLGNAGPARDAAFQKLDGLLSELSVSVLGESSSLVGSLCFAIPDLGPRVHVACA
jgi:hypothetical protein